MAKTKVLIASGISEEVAAMLEAAPSEMEIDFLPDGAKLSDHISDAEILYGVVSEDALPHAKSLQWVMQPFVGVERSMYPAFKESPITLINSKRLYGPQLAEHAFALLLSLTRGINTQLELMQEKEWKWLPCVEVSGMTMGILGLGGIGRAVAQRAKAFDFEVIAVDPEPMEKPDTVDELGQLDQLHEFLSRSEVLTVCCPITPQTHKLLSHAEFDALPEGCYFINVSRGKVVDEDALVAALKSGKVAGAGLDVTYTEPCPQDNPLWTLPNVILTSHTAGASQNIAKRAMETFLDNMHRYVNGEPLINVVDKEKGY